MTRFRFGGRRVWSWAFAVSVLALVLLCLEPRELLAQSPTCTACGPPRAAPTVPPPLTPREKYLLERGPWRLGASWLPGDYFRMRRAVWAARR